MNWSVTQSRLAAVSGLGLGDDLALTQELALVLDHEGRAAVAVADQRAVDDQPLLRFQFDAQSHGE
jgi:hypothetical protein